MKNKCILFMIFTALIISSSSAQEDHKTGIVSVTKDSSGKVTAIKLIVESYYIKLDEYSKQLNSMDGERTTVVGMLRDEGGESFITLESPQQAQAQAGETGIEGAAKDTSGQEVALPVRKTGTISITRDAVGQITAIKIIVDSYSIKLDEYGKQLESMDGQKVRVTHPLYEWGFLPVTSVGPIKESDSPVVPKAD